MKHARNVALAAAAATVLWTAAQATSTGLDRAGEYVIGTDHTNTLNGTNNSDVLEGRGGNDKLVAHGGQDRLDGGPGPDTELDGGDGNDLIYGSQGNDSIHGRDGDDVIDGGPGGDIIDGGNGTDTASYRFSNAGVSVVLNGPSSGNSGGEAESDVGGARDALMNMENLEGSAYADTLTGTAHPNTIDGGPGDDTISPLGGADRVIGGDGADTVEYPGPDPVTVDLEAGEGKGGNAEGDTYAGIENAKGGMAKDHLSGTTGANVLSGEAGDDILEGRGGRDMLQGGLGANDVASYARSPAGVQVNLSNATATGGDAQGDTLIDMEGVTGSDHADTLVGDRAANTLHGGAGDDVLKGLGGSDTLDGGPGEDTVDYSDSTAAVTVNLAVTAGQSGGHALGDKLSNVEHVIGTSGADTLTGNAGDNTFVGGDGGDTIDGAAGEDTVDYSGSTTAVIVNLTTGANSGGDAEDDILRNIEHVIGTSGNDSLTGNAGDNRLMGGAGRDTLDGAAGEDTADYGGSTAAVTVNLATGANSGGYATGDTLSNIEHVSGSGHADTITGNAGDNTLVGRAGGDALDGGAGEDTADYGDSAAAVTVNLATGASSGGDAEGDTLRNIEHVIGSDYADTITGNASDNTLAGGTGADVLTGGGGRDLFIPGPGPDVVVGGTGSNDAGTVSLEDSYEGVIIRLDLTPGTGSGGTAEGDVYTDIEGVFGSPYDDIIIGSSIKRPRGDMRELRGGAGRDFIWGGPSKEHIEGGADPDVLVGGSDNDRLMYRDSPSGVRVNLVTNTASGGHAEGDTIEGFTQLNGSDHDDHLTMFGGGKLEGHKGADTLVQATKPGYPWDITVTYRSSSEGVQVDLSSGENEPQSGGDAQGDLLQGGILHLDGTAHNDTLTGNSGKNRLWASDGDDTINGKGGDDYLGGGGGNDTFVFEAGHGNDTIRDFSDGDTLDVSALNISGFAAVTRTARTDGVSVDLTAHGGGTIFLSGISLDDLVADDFDFR